MIADWGYFVWYDGAMKWQAKAYEPEKCWVNNSQKICYEDAENAAAAARALEYEHKLGDNSLCIYKCEYGGHWHLAHNKSGEAKL